MYWDQIGQILTRIKDGIAFQWGMLTNENARPVELILARVPRREGRYAGGLPFDPSIGKTE